MGSRNCDPIVAAGFEPLKARGIESGPPLHTVKGRQDADAVNLEDQAAHGVALSDAQLHHSRQLLQMQSRILTTANPSFDARHWAPFRGDFV